MSPQPQVDPELVHVYPLAPMPDMAHQRAPNVVERPMNECWLCQQGICVQSLAEHGLIVHGTWNAH